MEFLYQTDVAVDADAMDRDDVHSRVKGYTEDIVVDPYQKRPNRTSSSPSHSSFRDRIHIMELHAVDQQVEQYNYSNQYQYQEEPYQDSAATCSMNSWPAPTSSSSEEGEEYVREEKPVSYMYPDDSKSKSKDVYNKEHGHKTTANRNIFDELYAVDLETEAAGSLKRDEDSLRVIMGLFSSDCQIDKSAGIEGSHSLSDMAIVEELCLMDQLVDGGGDVGTATATATATATGHSSRETAIDFVDPMIKDIMKQHRDESQRMIVDYVSNGGIEQVAELFRTDLDVDGKTDFNSEMTALIPLLTVDAEMKAANKTRVGECQIEELQELYDMDQRVDGYGGGQQKQNQSSDEEDCKHNNGDQSPSDSVMDELYATDVQMNTRAVARIGADNITAILDLYDTDCIVDQTKHKASADQNDAIIYRELLIVDATVDGITLDEKCKVELEFIDHMEKHNMRQCQDYAREENCNNFMTAEIVHLWKTDLEIDGYTQIRSEMDMFAPMLAIDNEMKKAVETAHNIKVVDNLQDLYENDLEVERLTTITCSHQDTTATATDAVPAPLEMQMDPDEYFMPVKGLESPVHTKEKYSGSIIMDDLYATDVQMDARASSKTSANDMKATMDLYDIDQQIAILQNIGNARDDETVYRELMAVDVSVDNNIEMMNQKDSIDFVDPIRQKIMEQICHSHTETETSIHDIVSLLRVDSEVDARGHTETESVLHSLASLIEIDSEMDKAKSGKNEHSGIEDVQDLFAVDVEFDNLSRRSSNKTTNAPLHHENEYHMPVKGLVSSPSQEEDISLEKNDVYMHSCVMDELYATDLQMGIRVGIKKSIDGIKPIMELYEMDRQIQNSGKSTGLLGDDEAVYRELMVVDAFVDMVSIHQKEVEFIDPMTEKIMHQHYVNAQIESGIHDIINLLNTDYQIDGYKQHASDLDALSPMIAIDAEVSDACNIAQGKQGIADVQGLYAVDLEIERNFASRVERTSTKRSKSKTRMTSVIDELYMTDLQIDSCRCMRKESDDIKALMELYAVDCSVDRSKISPSIDDHDGAILMELWQTDTTVDGIRPVETDFVDPMLVNIMKQHQTNAQPHTNLRDILHLLQTDMVIDRHSQYSRDVEPLLPLLAVDNGVNKGRSCADEEYDIKDVLDFFAVDLEVERMTHGFRVVCPEGMIPSDTPKGTNEVGGNHNLAAICQNDIDVDGRNGDKKSASIPPEENIIEHFFGLSEVPSLLATKDDIGVEGVLPKTEKLLANPKMSDDTCTPTSSVIDATISTNTSDSKSKPIADAAAIPRRKIFPNVNYAVQPSANLMSREETSNHSSTSNCSQQDEKVPRRTIFPFLKKSKE